MNFDHLRIQLDELERRAENARDAFEWRRIVGECTVLERSVAALEDDLQRDITMLETVRKRLRKLRARS